VPVSRAYAYHYVYPADLKATIRLANQLNAPTEGDEAMKNTLEDLRNHLFVAIEALQDPDKPMELERAKAINQTAQTSLTRRRSKWHIGSDGPRRCRQFFWKLTLEEGRVAKPRLRQPC